MIAKLIVRGDDRETAIRKMELALRNYEVVGLSTNIEFLKRLCKSHAFIGGDVETGFIEKWKTELFDPITVKSEVYVQAALGISASTPVPVGSLHGGSLGFGHNGGERVFFFKSLDVLNEKEGEVVEVRILQKDNQLFDAKITRKGEETEHIENIVTSLVSNSPKMTLTTFFPETRVETVVVQDPNNDNKITIFQHGGKTELSLMSPTWYEKALGLKESTASVAAPMPCKILKNEVKEGDKVVKGAPLVV